MKIKFIKWYYPCWENKKGMEGVGSPYESLKECKEYLHYRDMGCHDKRQSIKIEFKLEIVLKIK